MIKNEEKFITTSKLQANLSKVIKEVESGRKYVIMRYSKPSSVVLSFSHYKELVRMARVARGGACRICQF